MTRYDWGDKDKSPRNSCPCLIGHRHPPLSLKPITSSPSIPNMPRSAQPLTLTTFPTHRQKMLHDVYNSTHCVLSLDRIKLELVPHHWYVFVASTIYQPCIIISTGQSVRVRVCRQPNCAGIVKLTCTLGQGVFAPCWNR